MLMQISAPQRVYNTLPDDVKTFIKEQWKTTPDRIVLRSEPYFCRGRLAPDTISVGASPFNTTYTFNAGHFIDLFLYGVNGSMSGAGFGALTPYQQATLGDTNLQMSTGRETNDNAIVVVAGISIMMDSKSDSFMAGQVMGDVAVACGFGGLYTSQYKLGIPFMMQGEGGLYGGGPTQGVAPGLGDTWFPGSGGMAPLNGMPWAGSYRTLPDPIIWYPKGSPAAPTQFGLRMTVNRQISYVAPGRVAATGVAAIVPPATAGAQGTFVDVFCYLKTVNILQATNN